MLEVRTACTICGGRGQGQAIAAGCAKENARIVVSSRTESDVSQTVLVTEEAEGTALGVTAELTVETEVQKLIERVEKTF